MSTHIKTLGEIVQRQGPLFGIFPASMWSKPVNSTETWGMLSVSLKYKFLKTFHFPMCCLWMLLQLKPKALMISI